MKKTIFPCIFIFVSAVVQAQNWLGFDLPTPYEYTQQENNFSSYGVPSQAFFEDFNQDGSVDILLDGITYGQSGTGDYIEKSIIFLNNGDGTFGNEILFDKGSIHKMVSDVADYNNDGFVDLLVADFWGNGIKLYNGKANVQFEQTASYATRIHGGTSKFSDLDDDGDLDIVSISAGSGHWVVIHIFENSGGDFTKTSYVTDPSSIGLHFYNNVQVVDIDGNGKLDVYVSNEEGGGVLVLLQTNSMSFEYKYAIYPSFPNPHNAYLNSGWKFLIDYNDDGFMDLVDGYLPPDYLDTPPTYPSIGGIWFGDDTGIINVDRDADVLSTPIVHQDYWVDFNLDGKNDILIKYEKEFQNGVWTNTVPIKVNIKNDLGNYDIFEVNTDVRALIPSYYSYGGFAIHDLNNDEFPDLVTFGTNLLYQEENYETEGNGLMEIFLNNGNDNQTNLDNNEFEKSPIIYPNPNSNSSDLTIQVQKAIRVIRIFDLTGQIIKTIDEINPTYREIKLKLNNLVSGVYMVNIHFADGTFYQEKIVKGQD